MNLLRMTGAGMNKRRNRRKISQNKNKKTRKDKIKTRQYYIRLRGHSFLLLAVFHFKDMYKKTRFFVN